MDECLSNKFKHFIEDTGLNVFRNLVFSRKKKGSSLLSEVGERECNGDTKEMAAFSITLPKMN